MKRTKGMFRSLFCRARGLLEQSEGFTLVEILVSVALLSIAAAILSLSLVMAVRVQQNAKEVLTQNAQVGLAAEGELEGLGEETPLLLRDADGTKYGEISHGAAVPSGGFALGGGVWGDAPGVDDKPFGVTGQEAPSLSQERPLPSLLPLPLSVRERKEALTEIPEVPDGAAPEPILHYAGSELYTPEDGFSAPEVSDLGALILEDTLELLDGSNYLWLESPTVYLMADTAISLAPQGGSITMNAEFTWLSGDILITAGEEVLTKEEMEEAMPQFLWIPGSGSGQPLLLYVSGEVWLRFEEEAFDAPPKDVQVPAGYYQIPPGTDLVALIRGTGTPTLGDCAIPGAQDADPALALNAAYTRLVACGAVEKQEK